MGNSKRSLFFSSFIQFILELNGIHSEEDDLHEAPKAFDKSIIKFMRYYLDEDGVYYFFDNHGRYVDEDRIEESEEVLAIKKKSASTPNHICSSSDMSSSSDGLLSTTAKAYFDEWLSKILAYSQAREARIHDHIDMVANKAKAR